DPRRGRRVAVPPPPTPMHRSEPHATASDRSMLVPLVLAVMASQALIVVLGPTIVAIADDLGASVSTVGQARTVTAVAAVVAAVTISGRLDRAGASRVIAVGAALALAGCAIVAAAPSLAVLLLGHVVIGLALSCLTAAGFAGVAAFLPERRA